MSPAVRSSRSGLSARVVAVATGLVSSLLMLLLMLLVAPSAAGAHTDLLQGSPGPSQTAGGTIDFIDLVFVDSVSQATVWLEDPDDIRIDGDTVVSEGQIIRLEMPALTKPGRYIVRFSMVSADGDNTESGYFFNYDPSAIQPIRLGEVDVPDSGGNTVVAIVASIVFIVSMIGLVLIFLTRLERGRARSADPATSRTGD